MNTSIIRTLKGLKDTVKQVNVRTESVEQCNYLAPSGLDKDRVLKYLKKNYDTDDIKILTVVRSRNIKEVYEISISDFLKYARRVPAKEVETKLHLKKRR